MDWDQWDSSHSTGLLINFELCLRKSSFSNKPFSFSTTSSLYRKVVDVPGSNCTKKLISERVAALVRIRFAVRISLAALFCCRLLVKFLNRGDRGFAGHGDKMYREVLICTICFKMLKLIQRIVNDVFLSSKFFFLDFWSILFFFSFFGKQKNWNRKKNFDV